MHQCLFGSSAINQNFGRRCIWKQPVEFGGCSCVGRWKGFACCCGVDRRYRLTLLPLRMHPSQQGDGVSSACVLRGTGIQGFWSIALSLTDCRIWPASVPHCLLPRRTLSHVSLSCQPLSAVGDLMKQPCELILAANWVWGKWVYLLETLNATFRSANGKKVLREIFLQTCKFPTQVLFRVTSKIHLLACCFHSTEFHVDGNIAAGIQSVLQTAFMEGKNNLTMASVHPLKQKCNCEEADFQLI